MRIDDSANVLLHIFVESGVNGFFFCIHLFVDGNGVSDLFWRTLDLSSPGTIRQAFPVSSRRNVKEYDGR